LETFWSRWRHRKFVRTREVALLNLIPYRKEEAQTLLEQELGWRRYPGKHGESVITRFHQATYLPRKMGLDKRKVHLSNLICSGQLQRQDALEMLREPPFPPDVIAADREFVCKKFGLSEAEMDRLLNEPPRSHREFANDEAREQLYDRFSSGWLRIREGLRRLAAGGKA
jgi:hypothetical protein